MGKLTNLGWSNSSDEITQPISVVYGRNLTTNSEQASKKQKKEPKDSKEGQRAARTQAEIRETLPVIS
jgi:hypothetical protein